MRRTLRDRLLNLALLTGSALLCFAALEIGLRVTFGNQPIFRVPQVRHVVTPYGYKPEPNQEGTFTLDQPVVTNRFGFRDRDWAMPRPAGVDRVMVLGDSLTFGNAVRGEDTYPRVLEALLRTRLPGRRTEVITTATQGWNSDTEEAFFRQEGVGYQPTVLVMGFYPNDWAVPPLPGGAPPVQLTADGRWEGRPRWLRWLPYETIFLLKRSAAVTYLRDRVAAMTVSEDFISELLQNKVDLDSDLRIQYTYQLLESIKRECDARGIHMVLASIPPVNLFWTPRGSVQYIRHLRTFAERHGMTFVDLAAGFWQAEDTNGLYLYPWDNHLSPPGHRLVAEQLAPVIARMMSGAGTPVQGS